MKTLLVTIAALAFMATAAQAGLGTGAQPSEDFAKRHKCEFVADYDPADPRKITFKCDPLTVGSGGHGADYEPPVRVKEPCYETKAKRS